MLEGLPFGAKPARAKSSEGRACPLDFILGRLVFFPSLVMKLAAAALPEYSISGFELMASL